MQNRDKRILNAFFVIDNRESDNKKEIHFALSERLAGKCRVDMLFIKKNKVGIYCNLSKKVGILLEELLPASINNMCLLFLCQDEELGTNFSLGRFCMLFLINQTNLLHSCAIPYVYIVFII